jgi:hypothetical protein
MHYVYGQAYLQYVVYVVVVLACYLFLLFAWLCLYRFAEFDVLLVRMAALDILPTISHYDGNEARRLVH